MFFDKTLLERLQEAQKDHEVSKFIVFNDGTTEKEKNYSVKRMKESWQMEDSLRHIGTAFCDATDRYARHLPMDSVEMDLKLGLIYDINDIDENGSLKEGAKPLKNIVRYYTGRSRSFFAGEQTNVEEYYEYGMNYQGYVYYNKLVDSVEKGGVTFNGPKTFADFEAAVLTGEPFNIQLEADLTKNLVKEQEKTERKKLFKRI